MFDLSQLQNSPNWITSNALLANRNPQEALTLNNAYQEGQQRIQQNAIALQNQQAGQKALQGLDLTRGLTPDIVATIMKANPEMGMKLQEAYIQQKQVDPFAGMPATGGASAQPSADDLYNSAPPQVKAKADAYIDGRVPFPNGMQMKDPITKAALTIAQMKDPTLDASTYQTRLSTRKSFTSGPDAANITALNTAMPHLQNLTDSFSNLNNSSVPLWNTITNAVGNAVGNEGIQTASSQVSTDSTAVAHELAKVFRSTGMSEGEIKDWEAKISTSASPAQSKAVINEALNLVDGRLEALGQKYSQGMNKPSNGIDLLSPSAQKAYSKIKGIEAQNTNTNAAPVIADLPIPKGYTAEQIAEYKKMKGIR